MNKINKKSISSLGYDFIPKEFLPKGKNEYYLRELQHRSDNKFRKLTEAERKKLQQNGNTSDNWDHVLVAGVFYPELVKNCKFYGLIRIGKLEPYFIEFNNLRMPVGLYNSTVISCDFGDNVVIDNVNFMSHYILGNEVIIVNVNELTTTDHSKFGNGVLKVGESESIRIWLEVCNENGGRSILPFNGMLAGDAWLWSKYRDDEKLLKRFKEITDRQFDTQRGYYGKIGDRTVIKNCAIIKDVWVGSDAYIKGANKLKNLTLNSAPDAPSQIGEGCELVNGIIGYGCRIFYGVKAVRFFLSSNSQLKYGARLINSYLGDNSTISCCEVLNSLIFPFHEQHHNNSFLCAALLLGQSNMAAGATIGSNHNSRGADGEIMAGRGFWPGLCVSLKHNSKFASYTLIAKGDFPAELNIPIPFSLVSNDVSNDRLIVMPAYWLLYNMYALARNAWKHATRDNRKDKSLQIEADFLAPDTINEIFVALNLIEGFVADAVDTKAAVERKKGAARLKNAVSLLESGGLSDGDLPILAEGFENSHRKVEIIKAPEAYRVFKELITYYSTIQLLEFIKRKRITSWQKLVQALPANAERGDWKNIGGQLMKTTDVNGLIRSIHGQKINTWDEVHAFYHKKSASYADDKFRHAFASLLEVKKISRQRFTKKMFMNLLAEALATREWMVEGIFTSRAKDYDSPYRQMLYETRGEMEKVIGKLSDNTFINHQKGELLQFKEEVLSVASSLKISS